MQLGARTAVGRVQLEAGWLASYPQLLSADVIGAYHLFVVVLGCPEVEPHSQRPAGLMRYTIQTRCVSTPPNMVQGPAGARAIVTQVSRHHLVQRLSPYARPCAEHLYPSTLVFYAILVDGSITQGPSSSTGGAIIATFKVIAKEHASHHCDRCVGTIVTLIDRLLTA